MSDSVLRPRRPSSLARAGSRAGAAAVLAGLTAPTVLLMAGGPAPATAAAVDPVRVAPLDNGCGVALGLSALPAGDRQLAVQLTALAPREPLALDEPGPWTVAGGAAAPLEVRASPLPGAEADRRYRVQVSVDGTAQPPVELALPGCAPVAEAGRTTPTSSASPSASPAGSVSPAPSSAASASPAASDSGGGGTAPSGAPPATPGPTSTATPLASPGADGAGTPAPSGAPTASPEPTSEDDSPVAAPRSAPATAAPGAAEPAAAGPAPAAPAPAAPESSDAPAGADGGTDHSGVVALTGPAAVPLALPPLGAPAVPSGAAAPLLAPPAPAPAVAAPQVAPGPGVVQQTPALESLLPLPSARDAARAPERRPVAAGPTTGAGRVEQVPAVAELLPAGVLLAGSLSGLLVLRLRRAL